MIKLRQILLTLISFGLMLIVSGCKMVVLNPQGAIAAEEKELLITAVILMLIVVIPVIILTFVFAFKYRASNHKAKYDPSFTHSGKLEAIWWGIPIIIIAILATITWITSHKLDPYRPLTIAGSPKPLTIQVVALEWRWLFIYPDQKIATVNYIEFPANTPINFEITADAPMNSFQIPQLGGQIYAMSGMQTKLHLIANAVGTYDGRSVSFSGDGFSNMTFVAKATTVQDFNDWVKTVKQTPNALTMASYNQLAVPTQDNGSVQYFSAVQDGLFDDIIMKFMGPMDNTQASQNMHNQGVHDMNYQSRRQHTYLYGN